MSHMPVTPGTSTGPTAPDAGALPVTWIGTLSANTTTALAVQPSVGSYAPTTIAAIRAGQVVSMQCITETITGGTATFTLMINGSATGLQIAQTSAASHGASALGSISYNAGDTIGVSCSTSSGLAPSSGWDVLVWLEVAEAVVT